MNSHSITELYESTPDIQFEGSSANPLISPGALDEAELIDLRLSPQRSRIGIIFDVQWCDSRGLNTALVVLSSVGTVSWSNDGNRQRPWCSTRGYWKPTTSEWSPPVVLGPAQTWAKDTDDSADTISSTTIPIVDKLPEYVLNFDWLSASGLGAHIYMGHISGLDGAPPDMSELSDAEIIAGYPQWSSMMEVREHHIYPD